MFLDMQLTVTHFPFRCFLHEYLVVKYRIPPCIRRTLLSHKRAPKVGVRFSRGYERKNFYFDVT